MTAGSGEDAERLEVALELCFRVHSWIIVAYTDREIEVMFRSLLQSGMTRSVTSLIGVVVADSEPDHCVEPDVCGTASRITFTPFTRPHLLSAE